MLFSSARAHTSIPESTPPTRGRTPGCSRVGSRALAVVAIVACTLLGGCSAIRTVYNQADHVLAWRVDDYFDLTDEQKKAFHARFARLHAWHRSTQLQTYASLLEAVDQRLARGPAIADYTWAVAEIRERSHAVLLHAHQDLVALAATLTDQQIANARRRFERDNRRFARETGVGASAEEQRRLRAKHIVENLEHWTGPLDSEQQARVIALSEQLPLDAAFRNHDRMRRQREFLALLEVRSDPDRFAARLREWLANWNASRPPDMAAEANRYSEAYARMLLQVFGELRPEQRRRVSERVRWYVAAMRDLSRDTRS